MTEYEKYQLQWMIDHDHSIYDLIDRLGDIASDEIINDGDTALGRYIDETFELLEWEQGFEGGEIWASKAEWEDYEGKE